MITISEMTCRDYSKSSHLEWLETNGLGGFASGTVSGANTRRYHGLLVAVAASAGRSFRHALEAGGNYSARESAFRTGCKSVPVDCQPKGVLTSFRNFV